tara:strand:- start:10733 stop:11149 length:417 start_codon:yes stop_codon:yes gene_type:complete
LLSTLDILLTLLALIVESIGAIFNRQRRKIMPADFAPRSNDAVLDAWRDGVSARNHKRTLKSVAFDDGYTDLYSYELKIGSRTPAGVCVLADYTAPAKGFKSMTTSQHVCLAKHTTQSAVIMNPLVWESSALSDEIPF